MVEKMDEMLTPEMISIVILCLTALTIFNSLLVLITITSLSRAKKRLLGIADKYSKLEEEQASVEQVKQTTSNNVVHLVDVDNKIQFIENRVQVLDNKIVENQNQLNGYESKFKEYDTLFGQAGQMMDKEAFDFKQTIQRIHALEGEFQNLKAFQHTFDQTRDRILDALDVTPVEMSPRKTPSPEQKVFKEEAVISTEPKKNDIEELYKSRMQYHYPQASSIESI